jgi:hypothetical protein
MMGDGVRLPSDGFPLASVGRCLFLKVLGRLEPQSLKECEGGGILKFGHFAVFA